MESNWVICSRNKRSKEVSGSMQAFTSKEVSGTCVQCMDAFTDTCLSDLARLISIVQTFFKVHSLYTANNFQADIDTCLRVQTDVQPD